VGVEPTKSRLATLSGFEGQPPHRERFPSVGDDSGVTRVRNVADALGFLLGIAPIVEATRAGGRA